MTAGDILPVFPAFIITAVAAHFLIPWLRKKKMDQTERVEGVASHLKKAGTPTMGGLAILLGIIVGTLFFMPGHPEQGAILFLTAGFGVIGFLDDFLKVFKRRSDGLYDWQKLLLEIAVTGVFLAIMIRGNSISLEMKVPFTADKMVSLGWFGVPFAFLVILATVNGVNFTDGVDGLASSVTSVVAAYFAVISLMKEGGAITPVCLAVLGSLLAFLLYNSYPAKVFMGDTGSLALGGFVAGAAYMTQRTLYILIIGVIYAIELLSVALQVTYFKLTHGKRIFKMTPIHHSFELSGWSETRIVATFTIITILTCTLMLPF